MPGGALQITKNWLGYDLLRTFQYFTHHSYSPSCYGEIKEYCALLFLLAVKNYDAWCGGCFI